MEYATTMCGTATKINKSRLDKVHNMALRELLGGMNTTPEHDMEKTANVEPLKEKKSQDPHLMRKTEKAAFLSSTHKPGTVQQKSP